MLDFIVVINEIEKTISVRAKIENPEYDRYD